MGKGVVVFACVCIPVHESGTSMSAAADDTSMNE